MVEKKDEPPIYRKIVSLQAHVDARYGRFDQHVNPDNLGGKRFLLSRGFIEVCLSLRSQVLFLNEAELSMHVTGLLQDAERGGESVPEARRLLQSILNETGSNLTIRAQSITNK